MEQLGYLRAFWWVQLPLQLGDFVIQKTGYLRANRGPQFSVASITVATWGLLVCHIEKLSLKSQNVRLAK